jgi:metal-responsive CopG/Arc/MetJ family transcriptional regulator
MAKINVSIPDELLAEIEELAAELDRSRSGLVAEASAHYVLELRAERAERLRREQIANAIRQARDVSRRVPLGQDSTQLIREDRNSGHA